MHAERLNSIVGIPHIWNSVTNMPKTERRVDPCGKKTFLGMPEGYAPPKIVRNAMIESFGVLVF